MRQCSGETSSWHAMLAMQNPKLYYCNSINIQRSLFPPDLYGTGHIVPKLHLEVNFTWKVRILWNTVGMNVNPLSHHLPYASFALMPSMVTSTTRIAVVYPVNHMREVKNLKEEKRRSMNRCDKFTIRNCCLCLLLFQFSRLFTDLHLSPYNVPRQCHNQYQHVHCKQLITRPPKTD